MATVDLPFSCPNCGSKNIDLSLSEESLRCRDCGHVFSRLKLFFSYKHGCYFDQIIQLRDQLSSNGFYIWIDQRLEPLSVSWRNQIREAIEKSNFVLSFVSSDYFDSDVCKDELNIAACCNKSSIRVLLMEGLKKVKERIPEFISDPQWFDISSWVEEDAKEKNGSQEPGKRSQFGEIVRYITKRLTDPENNRTALQMKTLKEKLTPFLPLKRFDTETGEVFFGRVWLYEECEDWRLNQATRALLLYGPPGFGKSTFVDHYSRNNPYFPAVFFCKWNNKAQCTAKVIIQTIAYQLAGNFPEYRGKLADLWLNRKSDDREKELVEAALAGDTGAPALFHSLITEPLIQSGFSDRKQRYVVLIDALNEMDPNELSIFAQAFEQELPQLPEWLCFLFTSQTTDDVTQLFSFLPCKTVSTMREENRQDIREFTEQTLSRSVLDASGRRKLVDLICERSEGVFLYASLVVNAINDGTMPVSDDTYDSLPGGLNYAIRNYVSRAVPEKNEFDLKYRGMLSMICASPEPLPVRHIVRALSVTRSEIEDRLARFSSFLSRQTIDGEETVSLAYQYYDLWFSNQKLSHQYYCAEQDGANMLAALFMSYYDSKDYGHMSLYLLRYFLTILEQCGEDRWNELVRVIDDSEFLRFTVKKVFDLGFIQKSNELCSAIIEVAKRVHSKGMYVTLASVRKRLALNYINQGKVEPARRELLECEEKYFPHLQDQYTLKTSILSDAAWTAREDNLLALADIYQEKSEAMAEYMGSDERSREVRGDICYVKGCILYKKYTRAEGSEKAAYFTECRDALEKASGIWRSLGEDDDKLLQITFSDMVIGWLYLKNGEYRRGLSVFRETLAVREKIFSNVPDSPYIAKSLGNIARACLEIAVAEKDDSFLQEALQSCDRAISIYRKISGAEMIDYNVAVVMITKGDILAQQGEAARAVQIYQKSLDILVNYGKSKEDLVRQVKDKLDVLLKAKEDI